MLHTRRRVLVLDNLATILITVIGLGVILAVAGMMLFLISSSWPLFESEKFVKKNDLGPSSDAQGIIFDEIAPLAILLPHASDSCILHTRFTQSSSSAVEAKPKSYQLRLENQTTPGVMGSWDVVPVDESNLKEEAQNGTTQAVSCSGSEQGQLLVRSQDSLMSVSIETVREFLAPEDLLKLSSQQRADLNGKKWTVLEDGTYLVKASQLSPAATLKIQAETRWHIRDFFKQFSGSALSSLKFTERPGKRDGVLSIPTQSDLNSTLHKLWLISSTENSITGEKITELREISLNQPPATKNGGEQFQPAWIEGRHLVAPLQDNSLVAIDTEDSNLKSVELRIPEQLGNLLNWSPTFGGAAVLAEFKNHSDFRGGKIHCAYLDIGRATRLAASALQQSADVPILWSDLCSPALRTIAHPHKRLAYRVIQHHSPELLTIEARELTSGRIAASINFPAQSFNSLVLDTHGQKLIWRKKDENAFEVSEFLAPHIEVSLKSLFKKIRYESYENESYSWQSTSGSDEFQAKFSLIPLIWGTFKATLYSLLFAVPLAILAAIYSSEILDRQTRNVVKPTLEMMASVPSVVLGFLAAIVVAPWVETHIVSVLLIGTTMPFLLYVFGVFLQVPSARHLTTRGLYASRRLLMWVIAGFIAMLYLLTRAGLLIERTAFGGDLKAFLSGGPGTEGVLWGLLILPLVLVSLWSLPIRRARNWYRIGVFVLGPLISVGVGAILAGHTDLKADLLGQYAQRNTLVIAIAMGFAIIPIIYSLAEDALTSVPNSLRAGSLACGASVWQTTARVVLPTAASGLFSAIMVGLGRGIGETMIAVMATGNTAVMTTNPFDGLRSMAANIAVELPEAAQGSTHYRILFLSALTLFIFTFTLNSFAEFLRARYRARNKAL